MQSWIQASGWPAVVAAVILGLSGCGSISTYQTGKTVPGGKFSFGMGMAGGLFRTKSHVNGFPTELPYGAAEVFAGYGLLDFLEINLKVMASQYTAKEDFRELGGMPLFGGGSARLALTQERWGFPLSVAIGSAYYAGSAQERRSNLDNVETLRRVTTTKDRILFVNVSRDAFSWLTLYGAWKIYHRTTLNKEWDHGNLTKQDALLDQLRGYGAGISFNVGRDRNTHIMFEVNEIRDTDEPSRHYQKQAGLGMSVEF
ncbi:MAG: hypothetical protein AAB091_01535 [Elusimicrobiota bacterium]